MRDCPVWEKAGLGIDIGGPGVALDRGIFGDASHPLIAFGVVVSGKFRDLISRYASFPLRNLRRVVFVPRVPKLFPCHIGEVQSVSFDVVFGAAFNFPGHFLLKELVFVGFQYRLVYSLGFHVGDGIESCAVVACGEVGLHDAFGLLVLQGVHFDANGRGIHIESG